MSFQIPVEVTPAEVVAELVAENKRLRHCLSRLHRIAASSPKRRVLVSETFLTAILRGEEPKAGVAGTK